MEIQALHNAYQSAALFSLIQGQLPFATSRALNETAMEAGAAARVSLASHMNMTRNPGMLQEGGAIKVIHSHKRDWPNVAAFVDVPEDFKFLRDHEQGAVRRGRGQRLTIPQKDVQKTKRNLVVKRDTAEEALKPKSKRSRYSKAFETKGGRLMRRVKASMKGDGGDKLQFLHRMRKEVHIAKEPWFVDAVEKKAEAVYEGHFETELQVAMKSARVRAGSFTTAQARYYYLKARRSVKGF